MFATVGSENYMKLKFPRLADNSTNDSLHAFGALRTFRAGWLWCSCCCAEQERCHATKKGATAHRNSSDDPAFRCFGTVFVTSKGKSFHLQRDYQHMVGKKLPTFYCCKSCMKQFPSTSEKDEWRWITGRKPYKMALGKRQLTLRLDEIDALQNGPGLFKLFIRPWLHWFDHFLTKLSKRVVDQNHHNHPMQLTGSTIL